MQKIFKEPKAQRLILIVLAILGWFALTIQFYLNINSKVAPFSEILIRYFSYFTILTNLLVAVCCTSQLLPSRFTLYFSNSKRSTAIAVYILIVGLVYNVILRFLWHPQGLQMIVDELLHSVIPSLFLAYWLLFVKKDTLEWRNFLPWLWYPMAYLAGVLIRGSFSGFYPYPFLNKTQLGTTAVLWNSFGVALLFVIFSLLFIGIGKTRKNSTQSS